MPLGAFTVRYSPRHFPLFIALVLASGILLTGCGSSSSTPTPPPEPPFEGHAKYFEDHSYVGTETCLSCHAVEGTQMLASIHFQWETAATNVPGHEAHSHGKADIINNFCIAIPSNEGRCTQCHAGIGWDDKTYDRTDVNNIDCLICHDLSGTYTKEPKTAGAPPVDLDLQVCASSVGAPTKANCGFCHYTAGGGDNVKHGDLCIDLNNATREMDVHMHAEGNDAPNFACQKCHEGTNHVIPGGKIGTEVECSSCHTEAPHANSTLNTHTAKVSCQACHVPFIARSKPTKIEWWWVDAGQDIDPIPTDQYGMPTYNKLKGTFKWGQMVPPALRWFNGDWNRVFINDNDKYTTLPFVLAEPLGAKGDGKVRPFKLMIGNQVADKGNKTLLVPHLFGGKGGPNPYWAKFDWDLALLDGAAYTGQTYTGAYEFVDTEMYLGVNHGVAPKEQSLGCVDCHGAAARIEWGNHGFGANPFPMGN